MDCKNRKEEIVRFIQEHELSELLIIDDDKSLNELEEHLKQKFVLTELQRGFNDERLTFAIKKIEAIQASQKSNT